MDFAPSFGAETAKTRRGGWGASGGCRKTPQLAPGGCKLGLRHKIEDADDSHAVRDGVEQGHGRAPPLWTFGMNH